MMWIELLERYQNLIVGVVGFAGVILTLIVNAWQGRKQRREEIHHERQTLRTALIEELKISRKALASNIDKVKDHAEGGGYLMPSSTMDDAYRAFTHRIGLLPEEEVSKVMFGYLSLRYGNANLFIIGVPEGDRHVRIPAEQGPALAALLDSLISPVDQAIEVMERARDAEDKPGAR